MKDLDEDTKSINTCIAFDIIFIIQMVGGTTFEIWTKLKKSKS